MYIYIYVYLFILFISYIYIYICYIYIYIYIIRAELYLVARRANCGPARPNIRTHPGGMLEAV